jgi:hypothetical protein
VALYEEAAMKEKKQSDDRVAQLKAELVETRVQALEHRSQVIHLMFNQFSELNTDIQKLEYKSQDGGDPLLDHAHKKPSTSSSETEYATSSVVAKKPIAGENDGDGSR